MSVQNISFEERELEEQQNSEKRTKNRAWNFAFTKILLGASRKFQLELQVAGNRQDESFQKKTCQRKVENL